VWEFPIYSIMGRRFQQLTFSRLRAKFSRNVPRVRQKEMLDQLGVRGKGPWHWLKFLLQPIPLKLDFHNLTPSEFARFVRRAPSSTHGPQAVVSIGHTKEHQSDQNFSALIAKTLEQA